MRNALEQIKLELGPDAVIMSKKKIPEGIELMAAIDNHHQPANNLSEQAHPDNPNAQVEQTRDLGQDKVTLNANHRVPVASSANNAHNVLPSNGSTGHVAANVSTDHTEQPIPADSLAALLNRQVQQEMQQKIQPKEQTNHAASISPTSMVDKTAATQTNELPIEEQFKNFTQRLESNANAFEQIAASSHHDPAQQYYASMQNQQASTVKTTANNNQTVIDSAEILRMRDEMASIRALLEHQVAGLMWQDLAQKDPNRAVLVSRLQNMGISEQLADQLAGYVGNNLSEKDAWQQVIHILSNQLNTTNNDIIRHGGVVSLVGPTGVGKTTTIAKLAARFAQAHGADSVALISTDTYRIAGFEQLTTYARIIGCEAKLAKDHHELDDLIQHFSGKKLVLIDTAGMGQRDLRLSQYLSTLIANARVRIRNYLVLSANTQSRVMQENVERFKKIPLAGCIFTKLDESLSFGEIITTSIQNGLAIGYLTDGQRVPEDIKVANAEKLVSLADKMANKYANQHAGMRNIISTNSTACA